MHNHEALPYGIYGATGYTGRRVAHELVARGHRVLLSGRNPSALEALRRQLGARASALPAAIDEPDELVRFARAAACVINTAGPLANSAPALVQAALDAGKHYLDVSGEQASHRFCLERSDAARAAQIVLLPGAAFFSGIADCLAALAAPACSPADEADVYYGITNWRPRAAALAARIQGLSAPRFAYEDGALTVAESSGSASWFEFAPPLGRQRVASYPTPDVFSLPRHIQVRSVRAHISTATFLPPRAAPLYPAADRLLTGVFGESLARSARRVVGALWKAHQPGKMASDPSIFEVVVELRRGTSTLRARASGRGIYDLTAPMVAHAAERLCDAQLAHHGALSLAQVVDARRLLESLMQYGLSFSCEQARPGAVEPCRAI